MINLEDRITQFENMASADPDNDMAHFSLGSAYLEAGRAAEAAQSLQRCIELSPHMSRAYQLAGQAMIAAGWEDRAAATLTEGYTIATERGDVMVRKEIAEELERLGRPIPKVDEPATAAIPDGAFICKRSGRPGTKLDTPPFRGPAGRWIAENISAETWREWIGQGTKVINELRLDLSREEDAKAYDEHMYEFLGLDPDELAKPDA